MKNALLVFRKGLGPIAIHRLGPTAQGLENIPHEGGAIIAANHLAVIDDALLPLTCPRMIHFMGKAEYSKAKASKANSEWWFTSVGVFPGGPFRRFQITWRTEPRP